MNSSLRIQQNKPGIKRYIGQKMPYNIAMEFWSCGGIWPGKTLNDR